MDGHRCVVLLTAFDEWSVFKNSVNVSYDTHERAGLTYLTYID